MTAYSQPSRGSEDPVTMANTVIQFAKQYNYPITVDQLFRYTDIMLQFWGGISFHGYGTDEEAMRRVKSKFNYLPEIQHQRTRISKLIPIAGGESYYYKSVRIHDMIIELIELDKLMETF